MDDILGRDGEVEIPLQHRRQRAMRCGVSVKGDTKGPIKVGIGKTINPPPIPWENVSTAEYWQKYFGFPGHYPCHRV